jgi:hypothetical protein
MAAILEYKSGIPKATVAWHAGCLPSSPQMFEFAPERVATFEHLAGIVQSWRSLLK